MFAAHTIGTDHRQEHAPLVVRASAKIDAVRPDEDKFKIVESSSIPCIELDAQALIGPRDRRSRERRFGAKKGAQRAFEVARGQAVKPQVGHAAVDVLEPAPMFGQNGRRIGHSTHTWTGDRDRPAVRTDRARSVMPIAVAGGV